MVKQSADQIDRLFSALSDATRRAILMRLVQGEQSVSALAEPFSMSLAAISKHLKVLEAANIVQKTKQGRSFRCRANVAALSDINAVLEELGVYWRMQLDSLDHHFTQRVHSEGEANVPRKKGTPRHR